MQQPRDWSDTRGAFEEAAVWFAGLVPDDGYDWERPGLGEWNLRDLVGHTSRSLITVDEYLTAPAHAMELESPAAYFRVALGSAGDPDAVTARGRAAGAALGPHPAVTISKLVASTLRLVEAASPDTLAGTPFGGMHLADYLVTRTFELVVHGCDIAEATDRPVSVPDAAAADAVRLLGELALAKGVAGRLLLGATGRGSLPLGFTVL